MKEQIVKTARKYVGTPYHHQGRSKAGLDCVGLPLIVCWELGLLPRSLNFHNYERSPDHSELMNLLNTHCNLTANPEIGDLLVFKIKRLPQHLAIKTDMGIIHSYESPGKVVEHPLDPWWKERIVCAYELPQVAN